MLFEPFVVGAVIDLGYCLDLISSNGSRAVRTAYERLLPKLSEEQRLDLANSGRGRRKLDCAVVNGLHKTVKAAGLQEFDTVRGLFPEGKELYPGSGFREQTHIQICVRNQDLIHGVFRVADRYFSL